ncbi:MAG: hypothetical protein JWR09_5334 [Mucilaginibacter sp.]|nr:hypothetical protein [Mucilaginibacter sp.]
MKFFYQSLILLCCLFMPSLLLAQAGKPIKGRVFASPGEPVGGATVTAYTINSQLVSSTNTGTDGSFTIITDIKNTWLYITYLGYLPYKITSFDSDSLIVFLKPQSRELKEVIITSQKPFIEQQFDRLLVNVEGSSKAGMNVADILRKIPGVAFVNNNEILLESKGVTINIDGKPTHLSGNDLMTLLNSTASAGISQIEVSYNPSAKFDAQGDGGIINIKTLKRSKPGYDANISLTAGHGWKYFSGNDVSASLNYRKGSNYLYSSYSYNLGKQYQEIQKNTYLGDIGQRLLDSIVYRTPYHSQNIRLGWDHYLDRKDIIGFLITANDNYYAPQITTQTGIYQLQAAGKDSSRYSNSNNPRTSRGINLNINYKTTLDSVKQQEISMDGDAGIFDFSSKNHLDLLSQSNFGVPLSPLQQLLQSGHTLSHIYSYKADYSQKLHKGVLETGIKTSHVNVNNDFISQSGIAGDILHNNGSNNFIYKETVLAGYLSSKQTFGKLTLEAGLRAEQTYTNGNSVTIDSVVNRNYLNWFPNMAVGYKFRKSSLSFSYSRRIGRPAYNYLNPFRIVQNAYSINQGNPYLQPSFTNNYRLAYNLNGKFSFSASYSTVKNVITDLKLVDDLTRITTSIKANLNRYYNTGIALGYYDKLFNLLDISYSGGMSYSRYQFNYDRASVEVKQVTAYASLDNRVNLAKTWWADLFFYGQTRVTYGDQVNLPFSTTGISGGRKVVKGKGNLSLNINDIFFTGITRSEASYANVKYNIKSKYDSRNIRLNFSYTFGNSKVDVRKRNSGSADEQKRNQ